MSPNSSTIVRSEPHVTSITVDTMFAGIVEVPRDKIIHLVEPLLGFPGMEKFVIIQKDDGPFFWLQSIEDRSVAFCLMLPFAVGLDPDYPIGPDDLADLETATIEEVLVYTVVVLDDDPAKIRTNLRAPLLVSRTTNRAKQLVFDDPDLPLRFHLKDLSRNDP